MRTIYLDNNATTSVAPEVFEAMKPFFSELYGNPSSMHSFGGQLAAPIDAARNRCAELIGAPRASDIVFTSGGTESDNAAILSALANYPDKKHIIISAVEHPAVRTLSQNLSKRGYEITEIKVDEAGRLDLDELAKSIRKDTAIVSIMWANNETGVIFPVEKIGEICLEHNVLFHTDAVQAAGKIPIDVSKMPIDFLSVSGHKFHGPKGIGFLYIKRGTKFWPLIIGGHQEKGKRGGTENAPSIVGIGKAAELAKSNIGEENSRVRKMRDRLENGIIASISNARVHGDREMRLPNTTNIGFEYIEGEAILLLMNELGICASSGSACTSGSLEPSHVLRAMKIPFTRAHGSIRFSLSRYNEEEDIGYTLLKLPEIITRLRNISPFSPAKK
ncbi:MAG: cysteine desulfurase NifS [Deltaproteobacteria bacterium]|nr:cysteine desulfurase NifS [Deltaproteobacteria bacterium]